MSSLQRFPSLDRAEFAAPPHLSSRKISRHLSLPALSLRKPLGLPSLPPRKSLHRNGSFSTPFCSPSCGHQQEDTNRRTLASFRSVPASSADYEGEKYSARGFTPSISRKDSLGMEDSVVYRELCESIHLQVPGGNGCTLILPSVRDAGRLMCETEEKIYVEQSASDVRGRPMSLRMLKRRVTKPQVSFPCSFDRQQVCGDSGPSLNIESSPQEGIAENLFFDVPGSVNSAFASLVFMMESLQQHTLRLRRALVSEADARFQMMMERVHQEVHETFLWLFQKVFSCTPKLMLLTMILLADFAAHSMGEHVAVALMPMGEPPTCASERSAATGLSPFDQHVAAADGSRINSTVRHVIATKSHSIKESWEPCFCEGGAGDGVIRVVKVGGGTDGDAMSNAFADRTAMNSREGIRARLNDTSDAGCAATAIFGQQNFLKSDIGSGDNEEYQVLTAMWQQTVSKELISGPFRNSPHILVAPVRAPALEADDYACFDRTDLKYQHELSRDPRNPLLLANYAQFLHVVRHDHNRAEELYRRAVKADPVDGELIGKYASFLWVAKDDMEAADEAYKAAMAVDPSNVYHAGNYAHFLWNSGVDQEEVCTPNTAHYEVSTS